MRAFLLTMATASLAALADPNPKIAEARQLFDDLEFETAAKLLVEAISVPGNAREQVLEILELQGLTYGTWGKEAKARDAFRELLTLKPDYTLSNQHPPRVRAPFKDAKAWVDENAPLKLDATATVTDRVTELRVTVKKDGLRLVKSVRFAVKGSAPREIPITNGAARLPIDEPAVAWSAEVLGDARSVLLMLGPFRHSAPVAIKDTNGLSDAAEPDSGGRQHSTTPAARPITVAPPPSSGLMRPVSYAVLGVGAASLLTGTVFGLLSSDARTQLNNTATNPNGLVTSLTQRGAYLLESQMMQNATMANILLAAGGGVFAAGLLLFFLGAPSEPQVSLGISTGPLFTLSGTLP